MTVDTRLDPQPTQHQLVHVISTELGAVWGDGDGGAAGELLSVEDALHTLLVGGVCCGDSDAGTISGDSEGVLSSLRCDEGCELWG